MPSIEGCSSVSIITPARSRQWRFARRYRSSGQSQYLEQHPIEARVDLKGSDHFIPAVEAKLPVFFPLITVSRGSDPILFGTDVACMRIVSGPELICESRDAETWLRRGEVFAGTRQIGRAHV